MAFVERYVTAGAGGGGVGSEGDPWTIAEAFAQAVAGDRVNIKTGAYEHDGTGASLVASGDLTQMILYRGYNTTIGDLEGQGRNADGQLNSTDFPVITITVKTGCFNHICFQNLYITSSVGTVQLLIGGSGPDFMGTIECVWYHTGTGNDVKAWYSDNFTYGINSDFVCTSINYQGVMYLGNNAAFVGCRWFGEEGKLARGSNDFQHYSQCLFIGGDGTGEGILSANNNIGVMASTFYNLDTAVQLMNAVSDGTPVFVNNHATDCAEWLDNRYVATLDLWVAEVNNRTRDNTTPRTGIGDGILRKEITTDTGGPTTDYVDPTATSPGENLRLIEGAPGENAGLIFQSDVGALQRDQAGVAPSGGGAVARHKRID